MERNNLTIASASLRVTNNNVADRLYDMGVDIKFGANGIDTLDGGNATARNGQMVASFNSYSDGNTNFTFYVPASEQPEALAAINAFIEEAKAFAEEKFSLNTL